MQKRDFIKSAAAGWVLFNSPLSVAANSLSMEEATDQSLADRKLVWVVLRGAMDSLHAVIPTFDPDLKTHRQALITPLEAHWHRLESGYALHPALENLHQWYKNKQMSAVVAVASPYRSRSHFDGQDLLECGLNSIDYDNGWLARAMTARNTESVAIARSVPISLMGQGKTHTWYPSNLPDAEQDLFSRLAGLYEDDAEFAQKLAQGLETRQMMSMDKVKGRNPKFAQLAASCGSLLSNNSKAQCAMLEMGGWDTHNNQVGRLNRQFKELDEGLAELKNTLGKSWQNTIVVIATEFGRTVKVNGTGGTDHGTASALFLAGGALNGGQVLGQWPGLAPENLYEGRDLQPTSDIRQWIAGILHQHWNLSADAIASVFPNVQIKTQRLVP
ncbi:DUF1501 domain-containing protein [Catenovulum sediminis]|uniref:DUF1501 domain-containing protein n=1 Tax=Catenovulum sediminis TaxID=1740262 RepID=A0ABV1RCN6_9ALTE|nr:DUF1501 domain-containing protein [Catenovulum sediminis]